MTVWFHENTSGVVPTLPFQFCIPAIPILVALILFVMAMNRLYSGRGTCPRCNMGIDPWNSPSNCHDCGLPIDWSKAQAPQK